MKRKAFILNVNNLLPNQKIHSAGPQFIKLLSQLTKGLDRVMSSLLKCSILLKLP